MNSPFGELLPELQPTRADAITINEATFKELPGVFRKWNSDRFWSKY
jgi:hypothetical protein